MQPTWFNLIVDLYFNATGADITKHTVNAELIDDTHSLAGKAQFHEALFRLDAEPVAMQVRVEAALGLVVGVGYVVANNGLFAGNHAFSGHRIASFTLVISGQEAPA